MLQPLVWTSLTVALLATLRLLIGMRRFARTVDPLVVRTRTAWTELIIMYLRWSMFAVAIIALAGHRSNVSRSQTAGAVVGLLLAHVMFGFVSLLVWISWLSRAAATTPLKRSMLVSIYALLPIVEATAIAIVAR